MRILIIAYYYPPMNTVGAIRPSKFCKYLPQQGHKTGILTHAFDRTNFDTTNHIYRVYDLNKNGIHQLLNYPCKTAFRILNYAGIYRSRFSFWKDSIMKTSEKIINSFRPDILFATFPPPETLEVGVHLSERYSIPLVSDFRDGLLFESLENLGSNKPKRLKYEELEKRVALRSSAIITVSDPITDYFRDKFSHPRAVTIPNGYDPEDYLNVSDISLDTSKLNIVYTGRLGNSDAGTNSNTLFSALAKLINNSELAKSKIRLHMIGNFSSKEINNMEQLVKKQVIYIYGQMDRKSSLAYQRAADVLLLITSSNRTSVATGKLYEYLHAGKPILALTHNTYGATVIRQTNSGWIVDPQDEDGIIAILTQLAVDPLLPKSIHPDRSVIANYSRQKQTAKLSQVFEQILTP